MGDTRKHIEFVVPPFDRSGVAGLLRSIVSDCIRRKANRALAVIPPGSEQPAPSLADLGAAAIAVSGCLASRSKRTQLRVAFVVVNDVLREALTQVGRAVQEPGVSLMAFRIQEEAVQWLNLPM